MPWKGEHGFLAADSVRPAGEALLRLLEGCLPVTQYVEDPNAWWSVSGPALVARAGRTLESALLLYEQRCDLDAATLTRTLVEQLLTFAYLAHAPQERLLPYESADLRQSERIVQRARDLGYSMADPDAWAVNLLGPRPKPLTLDVPSLADHADREWPQAPLEFFEETPRPFRLLYEAVYRAASRAVHGKAYATGAFVDLSRQPTVVIRARESPTGAIGYEWAILSCAILLIIAGEALGWPARGRVVDAISPHLPTRPP